jgi:hypothetical protein
MPDQSISSSFVPDDAAADVVDAVETVTESVEAEVEA